MNETLLIVGMAGVTLAVRYPVLALVGRLPLPEPVFRALRFVPPAVLAAIIVPGVLFKDGVCFPDTLVGTDSHTGMIAGLGIVLVLANIMNLMGFDAFVQNPIKGAIIVLVAVLWAVRERSRRQRTILGLSWQQR